MNIALQLLFIKLFLLLFFLFFFLQITPKKSSFRTELEPDLLNPEASLRDGLLKYNLNSKELPHDRLFKYILMLC